MTWRTSFEYGWMGRRYVLISSSAVPFAGRNRAVDTGQAKWTLRHLLGDPSARGALIDLLNETSGEFRFWWRVSDAAILEMLERHIDIGRLLVLSNETLGGESPGADHKDSKEKLIAREAMGGAAEVVFEGERLRLIPAIRRVTKREGDSQFEIVPRTKAVALLERIGAAPGVAPTRKKALTEAAKLLVDEKKTSDSPGLVLVRRRVAAAVSNEEESPTVTPSQLARLRAEEKREILSITIAHRYHDDEPIQGAPFEMEFSNSVVIKGSLGPNGMATVNDVPDETATVHYGPDARPYQPVPQPKNPTLKQAFTSADADALADKYRLGSA